MSRVEINGQVKINNCFSIYNTPAETKVDRNTTAFSSNRPRNWDELCDGIDSILVDYTRTMSFFKVYYTLFIIATTVNLLLAFIGPALKFYTFGSIAMYLPSLVYLPSIFGFVHSAYKQSSIWERVRGVCLAKSVNGVRYELLFERFGKSKTYYIMVHLLDEEGQHEQTLSATTAAPVVQQPVISNQSNNDWASSNTAPTAPANNDWASSNPPPTAPSAPASGGTVSLFDQLRTT
jgi:hypothetical protein